MPSEIITKSELARRLRVTPSRVSQYLAAGMPVRRDGKLAYVQALQWIRENTDWGKVNRFDRGACRAADILTRRKVKPRLPPMRRAPAAEPTPELPELDEADLAAASARSFDYAVIPDEEWAELGRFMAELAEMTITDAVLGGMLRREVEDLRAIAAKAA